MRKRRVVITGMGAVSPMGQGAGTLYEALARGETGISYVAELEKTGGLSARLAGLVRGVDQSVVPRKIRRSMSPMSVYAYLAACEALAQAGLDAESARESGVGVCIGSTLGSPGTMEEFFRSYLPECNVEQVKSMLFFRIMGHTAAANTTQALGLTGRTVAPSAACAGGSMAIGLSYESIAFGRQEAVLCGGADEFHPLTAGTFDIMAAHSVSCDPECAPRPFDLDRDGVVCAEGAGILLLETYEAAQKRGANILAEVAGFATNADPSSIADPDAVPICECMRNALQDAEISPKDIAYINAHATGTRQGDAAEAHALSRLFGPQTPVSGMKGHLGHTMAASGALELIACIEMMRHGHLIPTRNLTTPAPECAGLDLPREARSLDMPYILKNSFALGGINCCLVLKRI